MTTIAPAAGAAGGLPFSYAGTLYLARPATHLPSAQPFYFRPGVQVFASSGGGTETRSVYGFDVTTVDARHQHTVRPSGFFELRDGSRYDRAAVASFWPLRIGKQVTFQETARDGQWSHTLRVLRGEFIALPAGGFDTFVVQRTSKKIGRTELSTTYTYWYAPEVGAIVRSEIRHPGGRSETQEAAIIGLPIGGMDDMPSIGAVSDDGRGTPLRR